jgi:hypothetical protein
MAQFDDVKSRILSYPDNIPAGRSCANQYSSVSRALWSKDAPPEYLVDIRLPGMNVLYCMDSAMLGDIYNSRKTSHPVYGSEQYVQMGPARVRVDNVLEKMVRGYMRGMVLTAVPRDKTNNDYHRILERHDPIMGGDPFENSSYREPEPIDTSSVRYSDSMGPDYISSRRRW